MGAGQWPPWTERQTPGSQTRTPISLAASAGNRGRIARPPPLSTGGWHFPRADARPGRFSASGCESSPPGCRCNKAINIINKSPRGDSAAAGIRARRPVPAPRAQAGMYRPQAVHPVAPDAPPLPGRDRNSIRRPGKTGPIAIFTAGRRAAGRRHQGAVFRRCRCRAIVARAPAPCGFLFAPGGCKNW